MKEIEDKHLRGQVHQDFVSQRIPSFLFKSVVIEIDEETETLTCILQGQGGMGSDQTFEDVHIMTPQEMGFGLGMLVDMDFPWLWLKNDTETIALDFGWDLDPNAVELGRLIRDATKVKIVLMVVESDEINQNMN